MTKKEYSDFQKSLISDYYRNLDTIMLNKLSELVSEIYIADSEKKKEKLWKRVLKAMENMKIPPKIVEHIMEKQDVQILAKNLQNWLKHSKQN